MGKSGAGEEGGRGFFLLRSRRRYLDDPGGDIPFYFVRSVSSLPGAGDGYSAVRDISIFKIQLRNISNSWILILWTHS